MNNRPYLIDKSILFVYISSVERYKFFDEVEKYYQEISNSKK